METKNPGEILMNRKKARQLFGISEQATEQEIKEAYRKLVLQYHPDRNSEEDAEEIMIRLNKARGALGVPITPQEEHLSRFYENFII